MKILALEKDTPGLTPADFQPHLSVEAACVWQLVKAEIIRETYFNPLDHTAVLIMECHDLDEAGVALATLPLVKAGLIHFELIPLTPYTGFERLFAFERSPSI